MLCTIRAVALELLRTPHADRNAIRGESTELPEVAPDFDVIHGISMECAEVTRRRSLRTLRVS